jgi:hypothetical protein
MSKRLESRSETDDFLAKVLVAAGHHAPGMVGPVRTIYEYVMGQIDFGRDLVEVYERNGDIARTAWVTIRGSRRVFSYSYPRRCILARAHTLRGSELATFAWNEGKDLTVAKLQVVFGEASK